MGKSETEGGFKLTSTGDLRRVNHASKLTHLKVRGWVPTLSTQWALVNGSQGWRRKV